MKVQKPLLLHIFIDGATQRLINVKTMWNAVSLFLFFKKAFKRTITIATRLNVDNSLSVRLNNIDHNAYLISIIADVMRFYPEINANQDYTVVVKKNSPANT